MGQYSNYVFDTDLELKAAGAITGSADGAILDIGSGFVDGDIVVDISALDNVTGDEKYTISLEGSNTADMTTGSVALATKVFGDLSVPMDADLIASGRYVIPFRNEEGGILFRYVRLSTAVAGTTPSIDFAAFIAKK